MTMTNLLLLITALLMSGVAFFSWRLARRKDVALAQSDRLEQLDALIGAQQDVLTQQARTIGELTEQRDSLDKKLKNTQGLIAKTLSQRDFWVEWYHRQASEHGAAQQYLLQELELHVKRGSKHPLNEPLKALVAEFGQNHPALADSGAAARAGDVPFAER